MNWTFEIKLNEQCIIIKRDSCPVKINILIELQIRKYINRSAAFINVRKVELLHLTIKFYFD